MNLEALRPDLFHLIVFGPGFGESIVLHVPPGTWIVIDGCLTAGTSPARRVLEANGATWDGVVLTHPHLDHARGLEQVLGMTGGGLIACADPAVADPMRWTRSPDPSTHDLNGCVEQVLAAIHDRWTADPQLRWVPRRGDQRQIGEATLNVWHPDDAAIAANRDGDPNRRSTALAVSWRDLRLVLGADVLTPDWASIQAALGPLESHHALKAPHHGSIGAVHACLDGGDRRTLWIVTPYNRGRRLPSFADGGGVAWALARVDAVHLTGLPVACDLQAQVPCRATRQDLRDRRTPVPLDDRLPGPLVLHRTTSPTQALACHVAVAFDERGRVVEMSHGPGAVIVTEAGGAALTPP